MLIWFGTSFVQGFAVTLTIGVLVSMFTAITVTRTMMRFIVPWFKEYGNWMFLGYKKKKYYESKFYWTQKNKFVFVSVAFIAAVVALVMFGLKPGNDFTGGSLLEVKFTKDVPATEQVKTVLMPLNFGNISAQTAGEGSVILKMKFINETEHQQMLVKLRENFEKDDTKVLEERFETVGPAISTQLRTRSLYALIAILIGIIAYIAYSFRSVSKPVASWKYGTVAVIALCMT